MGSVQPHRWQPTRLSRPWNSPGENTVVGCHFLLQCMKVKSENEVAQSCLTPSDPMDAAYQAPPSMGFCRQEYWSGLPLPSPEKVQQLGLKFLSSRDAVKKTNIYNPPPEKKTWYGVWPVSLSCKGPECKYFRLCTSMVTITQVFLCREKTTTYNVLINKRTCILVKLHLLKQTSVQIWLKGLSFPTPYPGISIFWPTVTFLIFI